MISSCSQPVEELEGNLPGGEPKFASLPQRITARLGYWFGATARKGGVALLDQMVVSGASFLTTILIGRLCGPMELGIYTLGLTIVLLLLGILQAVVMSPYTIYVHRMQDAKRDEYAGGVLLHCGILAFLAMMGLAVASGASRLGLGPPSVAPVAGILAVTIPFFLLRDFSRRYAFAHLQMTAALVFDFCASTLQVALLVSLAVCGRLTAVTAFASCGICYALIGASWLYTVRSRFVVRRTHALAAWSHNWSFSKWVLAEQMAITVNSYLMHWLLAGILTLSATGLFAACTTVLCAFNPVVLGLNNIIMPRIALAMSRGDRNEVRSVLWKTTIVIGTLTGLFCATILIFGLRIMHLLYGAAYAGQEGMVAVLAVDMFIGSLGTAPAYGLWASQRSHSLFFIRLLRIAVAAIVTLCLAERLGPIAAADGLLAGSILGVALTYWAYHKSQAATTGTQAGSSSSLETDATLAEEPVL